MLLRKKVIFKFQVRKRGSIYFFKKMGRPRPLFIYFRSFKHKFYRKNLMLKNLFKISIPGLFFFIFVFSIKLTVNFCRWLDSNRRPLELEATALSTEPQPLPKLRKRWPVFLVGRRCTGLGNIQFKSQDCEMLRAPNTNGQPLFR